MSKILTPSGWKELRESTPNQIRRTKEVFGTPRSNAAAGAWENVTDVPHKTHRVKEFEVSHSDDKTNHINVIHSTRGGKHHTWVNDSQNGSGEWYRKRGHLTAEQIRKDFSDND